MSLIKFMVDEFNSADGEEHTITINEAFVKKVLDVVDAGLTSGLGQPHPGEMCVEAAVAYASGEEHRDEPICVDSDLREIKIHLNDMGWYSNESRAEGLRRLAVAQLGTFKQGFNKDRFSGLIEDQVKDYVLKNWKPKDLTEIKNVTEDSDLSLDFEGEDSVDSSIPWIGMATPKLPYDAQLATVAEFMVQALITMKAPGTKFLYLTEKKKAKKKAPVKRKTKR